MSSLAWGRLPDRRVWERVSPAQKNGADVIPHPLRTRASASGNAVSFASFTGFADAEGGGLAMEYMAVRNPTTNTWTTHGISPEQEPTALSDVLFGGYEAHYVQDFSADLSQGIYLTQSPITDSATVRAVANIYLMQNLLVPGNRTTELVSDSADSQSAFPTTRPWFAGSSTDYQRIYFESQLDLTPDSRSLAIPAADCLSTGNFSGLCDGSTPKLYKWMNGEVTLVGVLPNGDPTLSQAGQGASRDYTRYGQGTVSEDGSRVVFTSPPFASMQRAGTLYLRDDQGTASSGDDTTTLVNVSERTDCDDDATCGGDGVPEPTPDPTNSGGQSQPASFWAADSSESRIVFTTAEQLVDADINHATDLYLLNLAASVGDRLTLLSVDNEPSDNFNTDLHFGHDVTGVLGISRDGGYVYFTVSDGQLVANGPTGATGERVYLWHDGTLSQVGELNHLEELERNLGSPTGVTSISAKWSRVSPDGHRLVFVTQGTPELLSLYGRQEYDHGVCQPEGQFAHLGCFEIYVYDATANNGQGDLSCASCNPTGARAKADADFYAFFTPGCVGSSTPHLTHVLSDDGRYVFFNSRERLVAADRDEAIDAYEYDTQRREVQLLSGGTGAGDSVFLDASADGHDVFFTTRDRLSPADEDQSRDLYDARIDGTPAPSIQKPGICQGEGCKVAPRPVIGITSPPSSVRRRSDERSSGSVAVFSIESLSREKIVRWARWGSVHLGVAVSAAGRIGLELRMRVQGRRQVLQRIQRTFHRARKTSVLLKLSPRARKLLARDRRLRLTIVVGYSQNTAQEIIHVTLRKAGRARVA